MIPNFRKFLGGAFIRSFAKSNRISKMPTVDLYYLSASPPCRTVEMVAEIAGVTLNKHDINLFEKEHYGEEFSKLNPLRKIPFLVDGDLKINESRAISAYLVNRYMPEDNTFYPKDPVTKARIDELLHFDTGTLTAQVIKIVRPILTRVTKEINAEDEKNLRHSLSYLDGRLQANGGKKFILSDELTLADVALATVVSFLSSIEFDLSEFKAIQSYSQQLKKYIPRYNEINDVPEENLRNFFNSMKNSA